MSCGFGIQGNRLCEKKSSFVSRSNFGNTYANKCTSFHLIEKSFFALPPVAIVLMSGVYRNDRDIHIWDKNHSLQKKSNLVRSNARRKSEPRKHVPYITVYKSTMHGAGADSVYFVSFLYFATFFVFCECFCIVSVFVL